uniref:Serine/threonine-protein phosphatase 4 regulatory subunit 2 n=1 Tax=Rhipicephalus appendiculatus TaxID=34631 RepID=A0A131YY41_RHIAP
MNGSKEALLDELTDFANQKPAEIPSVLDEYLCHIAKTGDTLFSWHKLKPLLCRKLELVMNEFHKVSPTDDLPALPNVEVFKYEEMKEKVLEAVNCFNSAPFTIQRLCELVVDPRKHYKRTDKFMRGIEKNVLVVSTIEPRSLVALQQANTAAVPMVNGIPGAEDGGINGHFADTTEDSLNRLDGENGHCEDEGICADDPGTNVEVPSSAADDASLGEAPQPVTEEVVEEQELEPSVATEQATAESSSECEKEEEAETSTAVEEEVEVDKGAQPQAAEEVVVETPAESSECAPPSNDEKTVTHAEEPEKEAPAEESVVDKDAAEEVAEEAAEASSESGAEDLSGTQEEPSSEPAAEEPSVPAEEHSEADALPLDASEPKPEETSNEVKEVTAEADCCDSSISEMPENEEELKEPPRKKFHPEPEARTEDQEIEEQEQPSSTSVSMDDTVEEEAMESSKADTSPVEDGQAEAMDTTADSSAQKDSPIEEELVASPDESAMDQD